MIVDSLVVVGKVARDIHSIGTRHTVFTGSTGYGRESHHLVGNVRQQLVLGFGANLKRRECLNVLHQMVHLVHAAQRGEDIRVGTNPSERPAGSTVVRTHGLQLVSEFLGHITEGSATQRLHYHTLNTEFLAFPI